jgi:hypothetical protein
MGFRDHECRQKLCQDCSTCISCQAHITLYSFESPVSHSRCVAAAEWVMLMCTSHMLLAYCTYASVMRSLQAIDAILDALSVYSEAAALAQQQAESDDEWDREEEQPQEEGGAGGASGPPAQQGGSSGSAGDQQGASDGATGGSSGSGLGASVAADTTAGQQGSAITGQQAREPSQQLNPRGAVLAAVQQVSGSSKGRSSKCHPRQQGTPKDTTPVKSPDPKRQAGEAAPGSGQAESAAGTLAQLSARVAYALYPTYRTYATHSALLQQQAGLSGATKAISRNNKLLLMATHKLPGKVANASVIAVATPYSPVVGAQH